MLDKNDTCEGKESHERRERVEESDGISVEHCFLDAIPSLFEKVERDESEISKERKEGTTRKREFTFQDKRKRIGGKLHHNHKETSISFSSDSLPLSLEFYFKELKLFLNAHVSHEDVFGKLFKGSLSYHPSFLTVCIYPLMLGDAAHDHSCDNSQYDSRMNDY
ncbi:hypothetical protein M9H77_03840 [Catharanthus roseus]|uniref:Uncharacterized protein n=1 Tax=Catharanthus roseus TaxID=4058 RepID=A0ACC0CCC9_CATRO|nr:hypothetical protein M9H77_03840 [Catharanthus roseus]